MEKQRHCNAKCDRSHCLCYWAFVCKVFLPLTFAIHLQRTTIRPCIKLCIWFLLHVHKGRGHYLTVYLQRTLSLFSVLFTKDCSPCLLLFICKGPQPLCCGIHSQRTAVLFFAIHLQRTAVLVFAIRLQRTAVLVLCYSFAKDRRPCLMLFICKGPRYLFCAIGLQRKLLFLLSIRCPGKISWTATLAKHGETASPSGFVKMAVTQIST